MVFAVLALASGVMAAPRAHHLSVMGATSTLAYMRAAVPEWERAHPGYTVSLAGGGSVAGLVEVSRGRVDVGVSDVAPRSEWTGGQALIGRPLGRLPILFIAHRGIGLRELSRGHLTEILTGRVRSWHAVGGPSVPVVVMTRPLASGALNVVEGRVLGGRRITPTAIVELSNGAMLAAVRETPGAVGFLESGTVPSGVIVLGVGSQHYRAGRAARWPYYSEPTLFYRPDASAEVKSLAQYLASRPWRSRFGLAGAAS